MGLIECVFVQNIWGWLMGGRDVSVQVLVICLGGSMGIMWWLGV